MAFGCGYVGASCASTTGTGKLPGIATGMNLAKFKDKARQFLRAHESHLSLQRLRRNQPLTPSDLDELGKMLVEAGGSTEVIQQATEQSHGLGIFIRSLVGLDRETAKQAFSAFVVGTTATASQAVRIGPFPKWPTSA